MNISQEAFEAWFNGPTPNSMQVTPAMEKVLLGDEGPKWCCPVEYGTWRELAPRQRWDQGKDLAFDVAESGDGAVVGFFLEPERSGLIWWRNA